MGNGPVAADELRLLIERVERLNEEIKGLQDDRKDVYAEAKSRGFCPATMKRMVTKRKKTVEQRREEEAMDDLYSAALGMLDGTPLGNWAVDRLTKGSKAEKPAGITEPPSAVKPDATADAAVPGLDAIPEQTIDDARRMGSEAARAGQAVTTNPFPPRGALRAAWDEAWCHELGSDGMEIPKALRPAGKPKGDAPKADDSAPAAEADPIRLEEAPSTAGRGAHDPVYGEARADVIARQHASTSLIQRTFTIGYNRATWIMEALEAEGIVSAPNQIGRRDVLVDESGQPK